MRFQQYFSKSLHHTRLKPSQHFSKHPSIKAKIPPDWKEAFVVPIFKKGDKSRASNYRPVSLTVVTCKILEHIICSSIAKHLETNWILNDAQHGFRKNRSCESQLILTIQDLAKGIDLGEQIDLILLDFSKAFDKVPHERLLYKAEYYPSLWHQRVDSLVD